MALSLFHKSPACYRALKKAFLLPSQSTLYKTMQKIDINAGFCNSVFTGLKAYASGLSKLKREVQGSHANLKSKFHDFSRTKLRFSMTIFYERGIQSQIWSIKLNTLNKVKVDNHNFKLL